jgi:hypothetical protein
MPLRHGAWPSAAISASAINAELDPGQQAIDPVGAGIGIEQVNGLLA